MKAETGDWLVVKSATTGRAEQRGLITEVHSADGTPPYVVRWLANDHDALVFPGPDAVIVTPGEQRAADERTDARLGMIQREMRHGGAAAPGRSAPGR
ncbi:hypothetical protein TUM20985_41370 [Mycobacterium antarcticum]|uniref:DUF1918 domain-containing protein n=1 Tax=unclassified Mycolicibacterium TaxID=2636767 RepID=UPI0023A0A89C|nr:MULTISPECIES: DUF1918 domain-containing protein [unclassified Mycolicibacterium]BDX33590.1 hypothetical protein TUM20985_41370 [Mycolicibacterium sp. TUM20985]GLP82798.1 hypothetical protein TUM20984_42180 [Mycolicibacterium sp. TUM20984]